uniref:Glycosyltransferase family 2 protein n=1 Tax=Thermofilum pendens TaxID=2269 RepID=A0A7J3X6A9_THEPE
MLLDKLVWNGDVAGNFDLDVGPLLADCLAGANMSFRRELLLKVKGFSPLYAGNAYRFETDLAVRIRRFGYRIVFDPEAVIYHRRATREGARVSAYEWNYWFCRNHVLFLLRCVDHSFPKLAFFAARQMARILRRKRACPYAKPEKWHKVLISCTKGLTHGTMEGLRSIILGEEGGIDKEKAVTVLVLRKGGRPLELTIPVEHGLSPPARSSIQASPSLPARPLV